MLSKLKCRGFRATSLSTYDFSTLYTTLPHNLIKEKLLDLIEWTFKRALKTMVHFIWYVMTERLFSLPLTKVGIHFGHVRMCATPCPISLIIGINDFSFQFRKIITRYRRIGYNLNVMRQSACLVFNPITVDNYAAFFNCTPVGRASDSIMAPT